MKQLFFMFFCFSFVSMYAQESSEKQVKSVVSDVTIFFDGAQETRKSSVDLPVGKTLLKFVNLSPFVDEKSVQVKADGEVTILSVNHQKDFLNKQEKSPELISLEAKLKDLQERIKVESTYLEVIQEDMVFLKENRSLSGKDQALSAVALKEGSDFFSQRLTSLKMKNIEHNNTRNELYKQSNAIQNQINALTGKREYSNGEVLVLVESKKPVKVNFEITLMVSNASWYPSYDIRAKNISQPIELVYKANIRQDTKNDWNNVKLKLSSYNPSVSGVAPELKTYFLDYGTVPPIYGKRITSISGRVTNAINEPLPGATIKVEGSGVSTIANAQGYYSLTLPANANQLTFSYIGFNNRTLDITGYVMNASLYENSAKMEEVGIDIADLEEHKVVVEERTSLRMNESAVQNKVKGLNMAIRGASLIPQQEQVEKQISVDFEIKDPYTIKTDNKVVSVDMAILEIPADFQYLSIPKINKEAFLIARIIDWEKYNFLEGEANVFFEDTYVGKTILNVGTASDTLSISLGRDKKVSVLREKVMDFSSKQFIGSKKEETREWKTTVRNNRSEIINMMVLDQVPVSTNAEIEVNVSESTGAKQNQEGVIEWDFKLEPGKSKVMNLIYKVKYPKNNWLVIE